MAEMRAKSDVAPENLRLVLLAFGIDNAFRVISFDDIQSFLPHLHKEVVRSGLNELAEEGLVTKFSGRYCFNKPIPAELRRHIEKVITSSGTIRISR